MFLGMDALSWVLQIIGTVGSVWGIELARRKQKICWWVWIVANFFWIALFVYSHLWVAIISSSIYQVYNFLSWLTWRKN